MSPAAGEVGSPPAAVHVQRQVEALLGALPDPALVIDQARNVVAANDAAAERFPTRGDRPSLGSVVANARLVGAVTEAAVTGSPVTVDAVLAGGDVTGVAAPIGEVVVLLVLDRSALHLTAAVRRDFVTNASHELKTPVAGIQALADALAVTVGRDPHRAQELVTRLSSEAERMTRLVHDLLDLRRLEEAGPMQIQPVDVAAIVQREVERARGEAAGLGVEITVDADAPAVVAAVEEDVRLIVANLVDNAVGYNREGGTVTVRVVRGEGVVRLDVRDTGIGMARAELDRIFERFYRVDVARSRASGRTGLGLAIVRHAAERHGGRVSVQSTLGEGSTFTVTLPVSPRG